MDSEQSVNFLSYQIGNQMRPHPQLIKGNDPQEFFVLTDWSAEGQKNEIAEILNTPSESLTEKIFKLNQFLEMKNEKKYSSLAEVLIVRIQGRNFSWAQCGSPHLVLKRGNKFFLISVSAADSLLFSSPVPLALAGLGLQSEIFPNTGQLEIQSNDQIFFLFHSQFQSDYFNPSTESLKEIFNQIVHLNPEIPFTLGHLSL